jgi:hypothetical protein
MSLILKLAWLCFLRWLAEVAVADTPTMRVPAMVTARCCPVAQGWVPPLVGHHHRPSKSLSCADAHLDLLPCHDTSLCLMIGLEPHLLHKQ